MRRGSATRILRDEEVVQKLFTIKGRDLVDCVPRRTRCASFETLVKLRDELDTFNVSKASSL